MRTESLSRAVRAAIASLVLAAPITALAAPTQRFDLDPAPLAVQLQRIERAAGVTVQITDSADVESARATPALHGEYDVETALALLLDEGGLEAVPDAAGGYTVRRKGRKTERRQRLEGITVTAPFPGYLDTETVSATKTDTPLRDIPQSITTLPDEFIRDTATTSLADALRYLPGVGIGQGEGNRDTPIVRGNGTTGDLFVDGVRDDVQYIRDLYNVERVEALMGPNAMIFGRGGAGGVINRVTKVADWEQVREVGLTVGSHDQRRLVGDVNHPLGEAAAVRVTAMAEEADSYRDEVELERSGINPTASFRFGEHSLLTLSYEHFEDERTADRGVPSFQGRPVRNEETTFFGNARESDVDANIDAFGALYEHRFDSGLLLRNRTRWADHDKRYQNVYASGAVDANGLVPIQAYVNDTKRENLFNQTDLVFDFATGAVEHRLLAGLELGRQDNENERRSGFFGPAATSANLTTRVPLANPRAPAPVLYQSFGSDNVSETDVDFAAVYVQDQITFSPRWMAVLGARYDRFDVDHLNLRNGTRIETRDEPVSPRAGVIFKPVDAVSMYASWSETFVPRAGDQLASLSPSSAALAPEEFTNVELGAKWELSPSLLATLAVYRLDRDNVAVPDPTNPARSLLVDGQRTTGAELGLAGRINERWQVAAGYAYQDGELLETQSASAREGAALAQTPLHSASLWTRYDFTPEWGVGLGALHRGAFYTSLDNTVEVPGFTRYDAAVFFTPSDRIQVQLNIENLTDREYFASAHNNNNILPGTPRQFRLGVTFAF